MSIMGRAGLTQRGSTTGWIVGAIAIIAVVAIAAWWYVAHRPVAMAPSASTPAPASSVPVTPHYPISEAATGPASASSAPLPLLASSDSAVLDALTALPGAAGLRDLLIAHAIVPNFVATVDALPRHTIGSRIIPLRTPSGSFQITGTNGQQAIDARNYARYDAYMRLVESLDTNAAIAWYVHNYPLFQDAYRKLGYPKGYFNDRLIETIDNMLAAPNAQPPIMVQPGASHGRYVFADPTYESLSVGQKLMIRVGPDNEAKLKVKLRAIRSALLGHMPPAS
ncbi:MAG: DUF3014 domain-containing protein [Rhodanobacteraceae bacterium]